MRIETETKSEKLFYRIIGELKFYNWEEVTADLIQKYNDGLKTIIMNWQEVERIDSSAMQTLVTLMKTKQTDPDFQFFIVTDNQAHLKTLEVCHLADHITIVATENDALAKCE